MATAEEPDTVATATHRQDQTSLPRRRPINAGRRQTLWGTSTADAAPANRLLRAFLSGMARNVDREDLSRESLECEGAHLINETIGEKMGDLILSLHCIQIQRGFLHNNMSGALRTCTIRRDKLAYPKDGSAKAYSQKFHLTYYR